MPAGYVRLAAIRFIEVEDGSGVTWAIGTQRDLCAR